jgi:hypothetical protein
MSKARYSPILPNDGQMWTNPKLQDLVVPKEMTLLNIIHAKTEFVCRRK